MRLTGVGRGSGTRVCRIDAANASPARSKGQPPTYSARCCPVSVERAATRSPGVPSNTTRPPSWPAPGPRSMIQSACAMSAWWCSMTMTDLPESTSRSSRPSSCSTSARWRPVVGSSRTYTPPFSAMWVASLSRCRSPPDSVVSGWPTLRPVEPLGPDHAARPAQASGQPAAVAHQLAVGQLVHLAPSLDAARGDAEPAVRRGQRARVEAGARGEPVTPLLRQRVDLEDLHFAIYHGHVAGVGDENTILPGYLSVPAE